MADEIIKTVNQIKKGDRAAFDKFYEAYHLELYRSACLMLGNSCDAEDVLQETFVVVFLHMQDIRDPERIRPWLYKIMLHSIFSLREKSNRETADEDILAKADAMASQENSTESTSIDSWEHTEMVRSLQKLDPKHRQVLVLYYYNELSIPEIAEVTGTLTGTVKSRLHHARKKLKQILNENHTFCPEEVFNHV